MEGSISLSLPTANQAALAAMPPEVSEILNAASLQEVLIELVLLMNFTKSEVRHIDRWKNSVSYHLFSVEALDVLSSTYALVLAPILGSLRLVLQVL